MFLCKLWATNCPKRWIVRFKYQNLQKKETRVFFWIFLTTPRIYQTRGCFFRYLRSSYVRFYSNSKFNKNSSNFLRASVLVKTFSWAYQTSAETHIRIVKYFTVFFIIKSVVEISYFDLLTTALWYEPTFCFFSWGIRNIATSFIWYVVYAIYRTLK